MNAIEKILLFETVGTAVLIILGGGVVANNILAKQKGFGGGWLMIAIGWALGVFGGAVVAYGSGAHLNPAVTLGLLAAGKKEYAPGIPVNFVDTICYLLAQMVGAMIGALVVWLANKKHFDAEEDPAAKLGVFSTGPEIRSYGWNLVTEIVATFVLVFAVLAFGHNGPTGGLASLGALPVALIVLAIGVSLGGPTGYAINPARDLGPRIMHAILPIPGKGTSDWSYAWVPIVGPIIGGLLAGIASLALLPTLS